MSELETARQRIAGYRDFGHPLVSTATWLLTEVERLRAELKVATGLLANRDRLRWGWNPTEWCHGYWIDGKWAEARLEDAITKAVKRIKDELNRTPLLDAAERQRQTQRELL